jgi:hypothetical protein
MSYNKSFYERYADYLKEKSVREAHDWIFSLFTYKWKDGERYPFGDYIDLGCGKCNEFFHYYRHGYYMGVDLNADENNRKIIMRRGDYRDKKFLKSVMDENHGAFVSLFSSEITAPYEENYKLYNWIFKTFPNIRAGLVSGFYYEKRKHSVRIRETGDIISFQSIENYSDCKRIGYTEKRIYLPVPSKMFGPDVVEVWKIFDRKVTSKHSK